ncbi:MAG: hypothetical protein KBT82_17570, partial [Marinobacter sp.]|uniref:POTRA domain-containing protein n=1 Tax=Marinobacter sp. TaxID=50741 RepID=UPI001B59F585
MEIREQQDKLQREKLQRELDNDFQQLAPPSPKPPEPETVGPCFDIISITFQGLQDLPDDLINEIELKARPFLDQCLALAQLSDLIEQLNRLFLERGLVTTRAFLPEQSLNGGELKIRIVVGEV